MFNFIDLNIRFCWFFLFKKFKIFLNITLESYMQKSILIFFKYYKLIHFSCILHIITITLCIIKNKKRLSKEYSESTLKHSVFNAAIIEWSSPWLWFCCNAIYWPSGIYCMNSFCLSSTMDKKNIKPYSQIFNKEYVALYTNKYIYIKRICINLFLSLYIIHFKNCGKLIFYLNFSFKL